MHVVRLVSITTMIQKSQKKAQIIIKHTSVTNVGFIAGLLYLIAYFICALQGFKSRYVVKCAHF